MSRILRPGEKDDGSFDQEFWDRVGVEGKFAAAWEMVKEVNAMRGHEPVEPIFRKDVTRVIRPEEKD